MTPVTAAAAGAYVRTFLGLFKVADEDHRVTAQWLRLLDTVPLAGKPVHDANIVATMQANQLNQLLTNNVDDFKRFANLIKIIPLIPPATAPQSTALGSPQQQLPVSTAAPSGCTRREPHTQRTKSRSP